MSFRAAKIKLIDDCGFLKMLISNVNKVGHIFLNNSFNYMGDNLKINTLTQNRINISKPGCTDSVFLITFD